MLGDGLSRPTPLRDGYLTQPAPHRRPVPARPARAALALVEACGSLSAALWQFVGGTPKRNAWQTVSELPAKTPESEAMSDFLRRRGFRFVGPTICYALMQAVGMVNDHTTDCFRYGEV